LQEARGQLGGHRLDRPANGERRQLRRLHHHRIARDERVDRVAEREHERGVPGPDDADDSVRDPTNETALAERERRSHPLGSQRLRRVAAGGADLEADAEHLTDDVHHGLPGLTGEPLDDDFAIADEALARAPERPAAIADRRGSPGGLRRPRPFDGGGDGGLEVHGHRADRLSGRGIANRQALGARHGRRQIHGTAAPSHIARRTAKRDAPPVKGLTPLPC